MDDRSNQETAIELLQQLGLKEYEARSFVALARMPQGTAKDIAEVSDVPRTRVYDAVRVLESKGLVEVQHSNPQQFRAVSIEEAVQTLQEEYESRSDTLREALMGLEPADRDQQTEVTHEVWALSGRTAIENRTLELVRKAEEEVIVVLGHADVFTDGLADALADAQDRGISLLVGAVDESLEATVTTQFPDASVFVSSLEWLGGTVISGDETEISRLLLVDRSTILVSTYADRSPEGRTKEQAVFGRGFDNGLVTIVRRLMATGLLPGQDPKHDAG